MSRDRPPGRRSLLWRLRRPLFLIVLLAVAGLSGVGYVLARVPLPEADVPVETTFLFDADGNRLAELSGGENRTSIPLADVSPHLVDAVLAAEDRQFFRHPGVNFAAITRAAIADLRGRPLQGGSTITQQYVKLVFVGTERTIVRKLKEATLAVKLERELAKEEILERYLNRIYFGRGAHGVQAAAQAYYGVDAGDLTAGQSAYLAGLIRAPEAADASRAPDEADARRDLVLRAMVEEGYLSGEERDAIAAVPVADTVRDRDEAVQDKVEGAAYGTQYFVEHVRRQLAARFGDARVNGGGLRVHTSIDLGLQRAAYEAVYADVLAEEGDPAGALVAVDTGGWVRAMVGGRDWDAEDPFARVNFATGTDGGGTGRQAGSSFKPFVLATAVADGFSVESAFDAPASIVFPGANAGRDYTVHNYENAGYGRMNLVEATARSVNTVYAKLIEAIGVERVAGFTRELGITSEVPPLLSITLGTPSVSVLEMASAYATFATRGVRVEPNVIVKVTDADGNVLWEPSPRVTRVMEEAEADVVNHVLRQVIARGTGTRARIGTDAAGKTGTTQSYGDAWFVGYTPGLSTAVWIGYPEGQDRPLRGVHGINVTGGSLPAEIWRRFMAVATEDERYRGSFVRPRDLGGALIPDSHRLREGEETTTTTEPEDAGDAEEPEEPDPDTETTTTTVEDDPDAPPTSSTSTSSTSTTTTTGVPIED
ncbi:MAG TPA: transglycosylase domain-containing protein [Acidimicrobiales bacterium]|nr:transglycosylase domain-containing protein [Acidimicrobiales bacterium]